MYIVHDPTTKRLCILDALPIQLHIMTMEIYWTLFNVQNNSI